MRTPAALAILLLALSSQSARAAAPQPLSFIHLATSAPRGDTALYSFTFETERADFKSGTVYFSLANGVRYGCGVHAFARCTLRAAGQTLKIEGLKNGITGSFTWVADPLVDNRPVEILLGIRQPPEALKDYVSQISVPFTVPEPASWASMIGGFALLGAAVRRRRGEARNAPANLPA